MNRLYRFLACVALPACLGDPVDPGRAMNHPANPNAAEAPFVPAGSSSAPPAPSSAPAPPAQHHHGMDMK